MNPQPIDRERAHAAADKAAAVLAADQRIVLVYLFGSTTDRSRTTVSDVDIAVLSQPALTLDQLLRLGADATIAAGTQIDLISLNDAGVVLAHEVADTGECLFARNPDVEVEFVTGARMRYWDFKPFLDEQRRLIAERQEERGRGTPS